MEKHDVGSWRQSACLVSLIALVLLGTGSVRAADKPVGFVAKVAAGYGVKVDASFEATAKIVRDGKTLDAYEGVAVYQGDAIETAADSIAAVAFNDESCVTLTADSRLVVTDYAFPALKQATWVSLERGGAHFDIRKRPEDARFSVRTSGGTVTAKGTKFFVYNKVNATTSVNTVNIVHQQGTITATNTSGTSWDIKDTELPTSSQKILTLTLNAGDPAPVVRDIKDLDKTQLAALKSGATSVMSVTRASNGTLKIVTTSNNSDGSTTKSTVTESADGSKTIIKSLTKDGSERSKTTTTQTTTGGVTTTTTKSIEKDSSGATKTTETITTNSSGAVTGGSYTSKGTYNGEKVTQTGTVTAGSNGETVITINETVGSATNTVVITRSGGTETIVRTAQGSSTGGLPAVTQTTTNPDGSVTTKVWNTKAAYDSNQTPSSTTTAKATGAITTTPGNVVINPGQDPAASE